MDIVSLRCHSLVKTQGRLSFEDFGMIVELFVPIEEEIFDMDKRFTFRTYFQVTDMMVTRVKGDTERNFSEAIQVLISEIVDQNLTIKTPTFYKIYVTDDEEIFTDIMIGIRE